MAKDKSVVFTFGRMNPPTVGHEKLINHVKGVAEKQGADHLIIASHSQDSKKNPLPADEKEAHLHKLFPDTNIKMSSKESPSFIHHLKDMHEKGYTHVTMVAGADRVPEFQKTIDKYNGPKGEFNFKSVKVVSAGARDPDAEGTEGMSASKMREHAKLGNFMSFKAGLPSTATHEHARQIYDSVRGHMGIKDEPVQEGVMVSFKRWLLG